MLKVGIPLSTSRRIGKNLLALVSADLISRVLSFIIIVYIARVLGDIAFGRYALAQSIIMYFNIFLDLGLVTLAIRELSQNKELTLEYTSKVISTRFLLTLIASLGLVVILLLTKLNLEVKLLVGLLALASFFYFLDITWVFSAHEKMEVNAFFRVLQIVLFFIFSFVFIYLFKSILAVGVAFFLATVIMFSLLLKYFKKNFGVPKLRLDLKEAKMLLSISLPIGYSALMVQFYYNLDTILLASMKGEAVTGWYNAAYRLIFVLISLMLFLNTALLPVLAKFLQESVEKLKAFTEKMFTLILVFSLAMGILGTYLAQPIILTLFGSNYINAVLPLKILIWAVVIYFSYSLYTNLLIVHNLQKKVMIAVTVGAVTNLVLNIFLIPKYSLQGAAMATVITEVVICILIFTFAAKVANVKSLKKVIMTLISGSLSSLILYQLNLGYVTNSLIVLVVYFTILVLLKVISISEIKLLFKSLVSRTN